MQKVKTVDVFTPSTPARLAFVERAALNDQLVDALMTPGKQVVVYGPSGSGKTTLLVNKLGRKPGTDHGFPARSANWGRKGARAG